MAIRRFMLLATVLVLASSCAVPRPEPVAAEDTNGPHWWLTATPPPSPDPILTRPLVRPKFRFQPTVPAAERALIRETIAHASRFFVTPHPKSEEGAAFVWAYTSLTKLANVTDVPPSFFETAMAGASTEGLLLWTDHPAWIAAGRLGRIETLYHEWFHAMQWHLPRWEPGDLTFNWNPPTWLVEGAAEFAAWKAMDARGLSDGSRRAQAVAYASAVSMPLRTLTNYRAMLDGGRGYATYALSMLAVEHLVEGKGGIARLLDFWQNLGHAPWVPAFRETFGMGPREFHRSFERYRAAGFRPN
jgi:hypothetical protein